MRPSRRERGRALTADHTVAAGSGYAEELRRGDFTATGRRSERRGCDGRAPRGWDGRGVGEGGGGAEHASTHGPRLGFTRRVQACVFTVFGTFRPDLCVTVSCVLACQMKKKNGTLEVVVAFRFAFANN